MQCAHSVPRRFLGVSAVMAGSNLFNLQAKCLRSSHRVPPTKPVMQMPQKKAIGKLHTSAASNSEYTAWSSLGHRTGCIETGAQKLSFRVYDTLL